MKAEKPKAKKRAKWVVCDECDGFGFKYIFPWDSIVCVKCDGKGKVKINGNDKI